MTNILNVNKNKIVQCQMKVTTGVLLTNTTKYKQVTDCAMTVFFTSETHKLPCYLILLYYLTIRWSCSFLTLTFYWLQFTHQGTFHPSTWCQHQCNSAKSQSLQHSNKTITMTVCVLVAEANWEIPLVFPPSAAQILFRHSSETS